MLKLPTILNATTSSYVPIYTQEKSNLENFYTVDTFIDQMEQLRKLNIDYDCILKAEKQMLTNSVSQESIDNKKQLIDRLNDQININREKTKELTRVYNEINNFNKYYDIIAVKKILNTGIIFNDDDNMFNKYLPAVFKNMKDNKHYMYLEL